MKSFCDNVTSDSEDSEVCEWEVTSVCSHCMKDFGLEEPLKYTSDGFIDETPAPKKNQVFFVYVRCRVDDFVIAYCRTCYDFASMNGTFHRNISICCGKCYEVDKIAPAVNILEHLY